MDIVYNTITNIYVLLKVMGKVAVEKESEKQTDRKEERESGKWMQIRQTR